MLGAQPRSVLLMLGRQFIFKRGAVEIPVYGSLRGTRAGELVNSDVQANAFVTLDPVPLAAAGINYLLKFDRLTTNFGESYTVQDVHIAFDGEAPVFHKAYVQGAG
jgi:hypothetical protein